MSDVTLDGLLDEARITRVLNLYAASLDAHDWPALDQVFAEGAVADFQGIGRFDGRAAIVELIRSVLSQAGATQHLLGNFRISVNGDRAHAKSYLQAIQAGKDSFAGSKMTVWGEYRDTLERTASGWRIVYRELAGIHAEGDIGIAIISSK